ncbi:MAG TPA: PQQ-binding-like beta-propeller repeat protein [Polyangiaceae bacterium]|nr:PQQ-binding-like beta-propeller repeat protein [Polyangiaceae bacterium]
MPALHLVARPNTGKLTRRLVDARLIELLVDGRETMPTLSRTEILELLLALGEAAHDLLDGVAGRATFQFDADREVWECGLELCGKDVLVSLYRPSPAARVVTHERRLPRREFVGALTEMLSMIARGRSDGSPDSPRDRFNLASERLGIKLGKPALLGEAPSAARAERSVAGPSFGGVSLHAAGRFKVTRPRLVDSEHVERSDLHALLVEGTLTIATAGASISSAGSQLFIDAERLVLGAEEVLLTWESGRVLATRLKLSEIELALYRTRSDGLIELGARGAERESPRKRIQLVNVDSVSWVRAVCHFALALTEAYCTVDERQHRNLRLTALERSARALLERASAEDRALTNENPDDYRRFARRRRSMASGLWERGGKMRFAARWVATVPGLDLRATFLCGNSVIVDSSRETACIDRVNGKITWRAPSGPAACTVSPAGLIRFRPDGHLSSVDLSNGVTRFSLQLKPRTGGGAAGSVVYTEGLPKILALTEGDRQISAVDLITGEVRWRHTAARPGSFRLRRVGKLFLVAGGSGSLFALDLTNGEAVWRYCSRLPFTGALAVDQTSALAVSGAPGNWQLQHLDPWTGHCRWTAELLEAPLLGKHPLLTPDVVIVPVGNEGSSGAEAFDRQTGRSLWRHHADLASACSAWLAFDDLVLINDGAGVLMCLEASTGRPLYNHVFAGSSASDTPRRLEPVLRNGALFVPQQQVHVVRPRSGEIIGAVPQELVPDLLRVDERCDVYVGEESGHLAAFGIAPRLAVVG